MLSMMIAAAAVAAQPGSAPASPPSQHPQMQMDAHQGHAQSGKMADMKDCCCKDMMEKMHSGHDMKGMQDHQEHGAH
ncbi:MAG TPA: hypothetical protein VFK28_12945 [Sphingomicrobium sp.]|nr:hypothetical protein [Sphingomicrobium sp.]